MPDANRSDILAKTALRVLLEGMIDYAGTFPPASLSLDEAVKNFARYRSSAESWMLGRFVVPASRLSDLEPHAALFEQDPPFRFSVLAGQGGDVESFLTSLDSDLQSADAFRLKHGDFVDLEAFEMRTPSAPLASDVVTAGRFINRVDAVLQQHDFQTADLFFEIPLDQNCRQTASIVAGALNSLDRNRRMDDRGAAGLKLRMGGTDADAFPRAERVALAITAGRDADVPFKATAGLHHPLTHYDDVLGVKMYGFLNLFVAAALATAGRTNEADLVSVLLDEDVDSFAFGDEGVEWKGHRASIELVARTRRDRAVSFGSCSFAEPVQDLRSLGLL